MNKVLTLDLGTKTGFAVWEDGEYRSSGTIELATQDELDEARKTGLDRRRDIRVARLGEFLSSRHSDTNLVIFEDVQFASTQMQAQLWASLRAACWLALPAAHFQCVPVATLKKFATGHGQAQKEDMKDYLQFVVDTCVIPHIDNADDNEIDAIWLGFYNLTVEAGEESYDSVYEKKRADKLLRREKLKAKKLKAKLALKASADTANEFDKKQLVLLPS